MWTRKDLKQFKDSLRRDPADSVIKVGSGETVTVSRAATTHGKHTSTQVHTMPLAH